jgi:hypothetical protein
MRLHQCVEIRQERGMVADGDLGLCTRFGRIDDRLLDPRDLGRRPGRELEIVERCSAYEGQGVGEKGRGRLRRGVTSFRTSASNASRSSSPGKTTSS